MDDDDDNDDDDDDDDDEVNRRAKMGREALCFKAAMERKSCTK